MCLCLFSPSNFWIRGAFSTKSEREQQFQKQMRSSGCHENMAAVPGGGKTAIRPHPYSAMQESTWGKMLSVPQTQENIHLESAPSWLPEKSNYRVQTCKESAFISPTAEGTTHLKFNFSEQIL